MNSSFSGRILATACFTRLENWSQNPNVSRAAARIMRPRFQPSFHIRNAMMAAYIGAQTSLSEKNCHIGSVINEFQLLISRVNSWSILWISVQFITAMSFRCHLQGRAPRLPLLLAFPSEVPPKAYLSAL